MHRYRNMSYMYQRMYENNTLNGMFQFSVVYSKELWVETENSIAEVTVECSHTVPGKSLNKSIIIAIIKFLFFSFDLPYLLFVCF